MDEMYIKMAKEADAEIIELTQGKRAIIDKEDFTKVNKYKWCASKKTVKYRDVFVAVNSHRSEGNPKTIYMHRLILNAKNGEIVDHINGNTLDNRKENLRIVNCRENCQNRHNPRSSKYPGVSWDISQNKWKASIKVKGVSIHLGNFNNELIASNAYKWACSEIEKGNVPKSLLKKTSKYKGVYWDRKLGKWRVTCKLNGKTKHVGLFLDEEEAHESYLKFKGGNKDGS